MWRDDHNKTSGPGKSHIRIGCIGFMGVYGVQRYLALYSSRSPYSYHAYHFRLPLLVQPASLCISSASLCTLQLGSARYDMRSDGMVRGPLSAPGRWGWELLDSQSSSGTQANAPLTPALAASVGVVNLFFDSVTRLDLAKEGEIAIKCYIRHSIASAIHLHLHFRLHVATTPPQRRGEFQSCPNMPTIHEKQKRYVKTNYVHRTKSLNAGSGINRFRKCKSSLS